MMKKAISRPYLLASTIAACHYLFGELIRFFVVRALAVRLLRFPFKITELKQKLPIFLIIVNLP